MNMIPKDTTLEAWRIQITNLRKMDSSERMEMAFQLSDNVRQIVVDGIKHRNPSWSVDQVRLETFRIVYGYKTLNKVYKFLP